MPVNPFKGIGVGIAPADMQRDFLDGGVLLIVVGKGDELLGPLAMEFFRPVAGLAGIPGRTEMLDRGRDRSAITAVQYRLDLPQA